MFACSTSFMFPCLSLHFGNNQEFLLPLQFSVYSLLEISVSLTTCTWLPAGPGHQLDQFPKKSEPLAHYTSTHHHPNFHAFLLSPQCASAVFTPFLFSSLAAIHSFPGSICLILSSFCFPSTFLRMCALCSVMHFLFYLTMSIFQNFPYIYLRLVFKATPCYVRELVPSLL